MLMPKSNVSYSASLFEATNSKRTACFIFTPTDEMMMMPAPLEDLEDEQSTYGFHSLLGSLGMVHVVSAIKSAKARAFIPVRGSISIPKSANWLDQPAILKD